MGKRAVAKDDTKKRKNGGKGKDPKTKSPTATNNPTSSPTPTSTFSELEKDVRNTIADLCRYMGEWEVPNVTYGAFISSCWYTIPHSTVALESLKAKLELNPEIANIVIDWADFKDFAMNTVANSTGRRTDDVAPNQAYDTMNMLAGLALLTVGAGAALYKQQTAKPITSAFDAKRAARTRADAQSDVRPGAVSNTSSDGKATKNKPNA